MKEKSCPVLVYFPIRGRAEPIRLLLEYLGVDYLEEVVEYRAWRRLKPQTPFGKVPLYREGDLTIADSHAILRYLARRYDLYGRNENEQIHCDVLEETIRDGVDALALLMWDKAFEDKRQSFVEDELTPLLHHLEQYLGSIPREDGHWVGNQMTYVDFLGWSYLDIVRAMTGDLLASCKRLSGLKTVFEKQPRIHSYLNSSRRPPTITAPMASFGGTAETS